MATGLASRITASSPRPLPPLLWVWAPSGCPVGVLLGVAGGGALPVAELECEAVDGAGAAPLDAAASFAAGADSVAPAALDVPCALAFRAGAERGQV
jgi:hypothetical protein